MLARFAGCPAPPSLIFGKMSSPRFPLGATKRRHWRIMAYIVKFPQPTVGTIFKT
jgi:hypothetical protein